MQRSERFQPEYLHNVETLIETISPHIQHKYKDLPDETRHANLAVAEFIKVKILFLIKCFRFLNLFFMSRNVCR